MLIEIDDDDEANPGPMPQLEDMNPYLSALRAQLESADKEEAQLRAVRRQKDDALQAQKIYQARLAEEASKARDKELAASVAKSALLAEIERAKSVEAAPEPETLSPRSVAMPPYAAWRLNAAPVTLDLAWRGDANVDDVPPQLVEAEPKPSDVEGVVAAMGDNDDKPVVKDVAATDDDVPIVVEDVVAATGGHKAAHDCQEQPVVETGGTDGAAGGGAENGGADADAHGVDVQGADVEMEGADAEEEGGGGERRRTRSTRTASRRRRAAPRAASSSRRAPLRAVARRASRRRAAVPTARRSTPRPWTRRTTTTPSPASRQASRLASSRRTTSTTSRRATSTTSW